MQEPLETQVQSLARDNPLEKEVAPHSSIFAWEIPWTEEPGRLYPWGCKELDMTKRLSTHTLWNMTFHVSFRSSDCTKIISLIFSFRFSCACMKSETVTVNVLSLLKELYQLLDDAVLLQYHCIFLVKRSIPVMVQVSCLIHGIKVKHSEVHSVKCETHDIVKWKWKWSRSVMSDSLRSHGLYVAYQAPPSMGFSRQEYWSGLWYCVNCDIEWQTATYMVKLLGLGDVKNILK